MKALVIAVFLCSFIYSEQRSTPEDTSYVAAVLEYEVQSNEETNVRNYVQYIQEAASQNADIVVFPEMTLTRGSSIVVPIYGTLVQYPVPALEPTRYHEILVAISAAARQNQIYVLINIQELMNCNDAPGEYCPEAKEYNFNTNVIFDRNGAVIDRYRKINLFGEYSRTPALQPNLGIFSTDFGVTFGHHICFDLMFQVPAIQVIEKNNITDVLFSTMWFSEMPYLTAVQIQEAYAYSLNINFLASGANNVRVGSAGSGIYSGKAGALVSIMPGVPTSRLLVARVPKVPGQVTGNYPGPIYDDPSDHDGLLLKSDPSIPSFITRPLVPGYQEFTLVDKEVSCKFRIRMSARNAVVAHQYRAVVQDASNLYVRREIGIAACVVVACKNNNAKTCPYRFSNEQTMKIEELEIEMTSYRLHYNESLRCDDIVYYPSSFQTNKFPLNPKNFTFIDTNRNDHLYNMEDGREHVKFTLNAPQENLVSFGIWGRVYNKDINHNNMVTEEDVQNYLGIENEIFGNNDPKITEDHSIKLDD